MNVKRKMAVTRGQSCYTPEELWGLLMLGSALVMDIAGRRGVRLVRRKTCNWQRGSGIWTDDRFTDAKEYKMARSDYRAIDSSLRLARYR